MPQFKYAAYLPSGEEQSGVVLASDELEALKRLSERNLSVFNITEGGQAIRWWQREISFASRSKADPRQLALMFSNLASLLEVGVPLDRAVSFCSSKVASPRLKIALSDMANAIQDGQSLSDGMKTVTDVLPEQLINMVEIGERSNKLIETCTLIAESSMREAQQRQEIRSALVYPAILLTMSLMTLVLLIFYLAPTLQPVFSSSNAAPPKIIAYLTELRLILIKNWPQLIALLIAISVLARLSFSRIKQGFSPLLLGLPFVGNYIREAETLRLLQTLSLMLSSGSTLLQAIQTAGSSVTHPSYRKLVQKSQTDVEAGRTFSSTLSETNLVPPMTKAMIEAAEESDHLINVFSRIVGELSENKKRRNAEAVKLIGPVFTLVIGLGIGMVILSTINAILSLNDVAF